jgi:hypothetical protein
MCDEVTDANYANLDKSIVATSTVLGVAFLKQSDERRAAADAKAAAIAAQALWASPLGQARLAFERGDVVFSSRCRSQSRRRSSRR